MSLSIVPNSFWQFPSLRLPSLWDDDQDWDLSSSPSGLSVSEDDKKIYVKASVPGIKPDDVEITYDPDKGVLSIAGEAKEEEEDKKRKFYRKASSSFSYRVLVPGKVDDKEEPEAICKDGIMTVTFNKVPETKPKKIAVKKG